MKPTDFSKYISDFISRYLPNEKGVSPNTITAYRDTFVLLLNFVQEHKRIKVEKLSLESITKETILEFLDHLEKSRKCSKSTRNARLAAIHSFYKYLQGETLHYLHECQKILSIKFKRSANKSLNYPSIEGIKLLLEQPDASTIKGRRDLTLLALLYDSGARVQEIIDLAPSSLRLNKPCTIKIIGKGNKARIVPMLDMQTDHLKNYLKEHMLNEPYANRYPLFFNSRKEKLTRAGVGYIIDKYARAARKVNEQLIPEKFSPHSLRHSKAMHLLQAGVNLVYIRDILGHVSIQTTEIYAKADSMQKRKALESAYVNINPKEEAQWVKDEGLIAWLKRF
ncbi:MAG: site-specific integrase [Niabella sp.]